MYTPLFMISVMFDLFVCLFQVLSALDILQPPHIDFFQEMYPLTICECL